jgi:hypothetical protein
MRAAGNAKAVNEAVVSNAVTNAAANSAVKQSADLRTVIEEFGRLLELLAGQLTASVNDASRDCAMVGDTFEAIATANARLKAIEAKEADVAPLRACGERITQSLDAAVIALQYHDRFTQRIGNIRAGLNRLQMMLQDGTERSFEDWLTLLRHVEGSYQAEQSRLLGAHITPKGTEEIF